MWPSYFLPFMADKLPSPSSPEQAGEAMSAFEGAVRRAAALEDKWDVFQCVEVDEGTGQARPTYYFAHSWLMDVMMVAQLRPIKTLVQPLPDHVSAALGPAQAFAQSAGSAMVGDKAGWAAKGFSGAFALEVDAAWASDELVPHAAWARCQTRLGEGGISQACLCASSVCQVSQHGSAWCLRAIDFLVKRFVIGTPVPHPLSPALTREQLADPRWVQQVCIPTPCAFVSCLD